jgi:ankyrin repeat protein
VFPCAGQAQQQSKQELTCSEEHKQPQISCQQQQDDLHHQQHQDEQEQQLEQPEHEALPSAVDDNIQQRQQQHQVLQQVQPHPSLEQQLVSFRRLRQTVNARDLYRRTPLIVAAKQGHLHCTQLLVEGAANLFAVDREGNT